MIYKDDAVLFEFNENGAVQNICQIGKNNTF